MNTYSILDFGAAGDGITNDADAIQKAIDACTASGGGTVRVPAGRTFLTGAIRLKDFVNLHLEPGSALVSSDQQPDFPDGVVIGARDARDISITGTGTIDGRARRFMTAEMPHIYQGNLWRPRLIVLVGCRNVAIRDITIRNSANWALTPAGCVNVVIQGINLLNDLKVPNCDGIDPENCRNVRISDCHIEAGDDAICLKSSREWMDFGPCENVTVTGCTLVSTSCAIKVGSGVWNSVRDCVFDACVIKTSNRGLGIQHRDAGSVENLLFSNMIIETRLFHDDWWGKSEPIYVTAHPRENGKPVGPVRNIRFTNLLCRGESGVYIRGSEQCRPEGILLENVRVEIAKTTRHAGGKYDGRPGVRGIVSQRIAGVYCEAADDVTLRDVRVAWGAGRPQYYGPALEVADTRGLRVEGFRGGAAHPSRSPAALVNGRPAEEAGIRIEPAI